MSNVKRGFLAWLKIAGYCGDHESVSYSKIRMITLMKLYRCTVLHLIYLYLVDDDDYDDVDAIQVYSPVSDLPSPG